MSTSKKYCHMVGQPFTPYEVFIQDTAYKACQDIGGNLPTVTSQTDNDNIEAFMTYVHNLYQHQGPFYTKGLTLPVSIVTRCEML